MRVFKVFKCPKMWHRKWTSAINCSSNMRSKKCASRLCLHVRRKDKISWRSSQKRSKTFPLLSHLTLLWTSKSVCSVDASAGNIRKRRCWRLEVERMKFTMFITVSMVFFRSPLSFAHSTTWWMMRCKNCVCGATAANLVTSPFTLPVIAGAPSVTNKQTFCKSSSCSLKSVTIFWKITSPVVRPSSGTSPSSSSRKRTPS